MRILGEGVAIVASILIAFAIDAWWQDRQDRGRERAELANLQAEFEFNLRELDRLAAWHRMTAGSARRLLDLSRAGRADPNPATMDSLVLNVFILPGTYNPRQGALNAVLASGGLALIRDAELRQRLGAWSGALEELTEDEEALWRDVQDRWTPALQVRIPLDRVYALSQDSISDAPAPDYREILGDALLENYMLARMDMVHALLSAYDELRAMLLEILAMTRVQEKGR